MQLNERIIAFSKLGEVIVRSNEELEAQVGKARYMNPWFTNESIWDSLNAIRSNFLNRDKLESWLNDYKIQFLDDV